MSILIEFILNVSYNVHIEIGFKGINIFSLSPFTIKTR